MSVKWWDWLGDDSVHNMLAAKPAGHEFDS